MRILEKIVRRGFHLAVMAHFSHFRELETPAVGAALQRLRNAGAVIRCQAPLIRHVNDDSEIWARMWEAEVRLGAVPYYMFVERDTGPKNYFGVPLVRAHEIYTEAFRRVSGLCRTVRGPSMSATPGKVLVDGVARIHGQRVLALRFVQGRDSRWVNRIFFAAYDETAEWLDELRPAFGQEKFFFEIAPDMRFRTLTPQGKIRGSHSDRLSEAV
jgi:L-lysine 2,3-aminomutase